MEKTMTHIILSHNGDPFGKGFIGSLGDSAKADCMVYLGDIGARSRAWWRAYAKRNGYKLVEYRK